MIKLHDYQENIVNSFFEKIEQKKSILVQSFTGSGKTFTFAFICKKWIEQNRGKILITCHRKELVDQAIETLRAINVSCEPITASTKVQKTFVDVYVAMIETVNNRIIKDKFNIKNINLVISDECHILVHNKIYDFFPQAKILGFTATPVILKKEKFFKCKICNSENENQKECCGYDQEEWTRPFAMSKLYEDIILGPSFEKLHEIGQLVPEVTFVKNASSLENLEIDSKTGDFSTKSMDNTFGTDDAIFNVVLNYKELCKGKRTIIFNSSTKTNLLVYEQFKKEGLNVKMYDSVNKSDMSRKQIVDWFKNTDDAILCNASVFTTGFDCKEVQAIILNRATLSLSLFLQIVGRGGRSSNKIFKEDFVFIDGGDNVSRFGEWSQNRDWEDIFWNGIGKPKAKKNDIEDIQDCPECGFLFPKRENECPECGQEIKYPPPKSNDQLLSEDVAMPIRKIPPPNAKKIFEYTIRQNENIHFSFRILQNRIVDMFVYYRVTRDKYISAKNKGELEKKVRKMIYPCYFDFIKRPEFIDDTNRTIDYIVEKTLLKLEKYYGC